jgi:hypothetical protein|tara:strand:- start:1661 stop:2950 length:1290 start_codon:yes stop_codon:yes gene_type:complete
MKKNIFILLSFILISCSSISGTDETKEVEALISNTSEKIGEKRNVSLQEIGFERILPDLVYQNYLVLQDFDFVKQKAQIKGYEIIGEDFLYAPGKQNKDKFSINLSGGKVLLLKKDNILFVIFRSTSGDRSDFTKNVITDLDGALVSTSWIDEENILVHRGFETEYLRYRESINKIIINENPSKIIFTGHSLGSALAALSALDLSMNYGYDVSLLALGAPRVGNSEYRKLMDEYVKDNYRIYFPQDPISNIPGTLFDYEHTGLALGISPEGKHDYNISIDNFGFTAYRAIFDERFNIHKYPSYFKAINKILSDCYKDESKCFNMQQAYMTMMVERETMNQYRTAIKNKPAEITNELIESAVTSLKDEKTKIENLSNDALEKANIELSQNLESIINLNKEKTEWAETYKEKASSLKERAKERAKEIISTK